jgi:hypothetical protein
LTIAKLKSAAKETEITTSANTDATTEPTLAEQTTEVPVY